MALTWQGADGASLPKPYTSHAVEGPAPQIRYQVERSSNGLEYGVQLPQRKPFSTIVETVVGGSRHGLSFLFRVPEIDGLRLHRAPLVEGRYLHSTPRGQLVLSPGFPESKPSSYETALGRTLSPQFERKCLGCHGAVSQVNTAEAPGVHCESCHGPGESHLKAVARGNAKDGIINPARLPHEQALATCAPCHSGFSEISDPLPDDLLISNQVTALVNSECYVQSGKGLSCRNCHDPHRDSATVADRSNAACAACHSTAVPSHAALCPVNRKDGCVGCHMPAVDKGSFHLTDHWIRVLPGRPAQNISRDPSWGSQRRPLREFLRIIVLPDAVKAQHVHTRLAKGESFFDLAAQYSEDATAPGGGYLGEAWLDQMDAKLAAAAATLRYGETSSVIQAGSKHIILQRLPRDFKWQSDQLQKKATGLKSQGALDKAIQTYMEALRIYPQNLRALIFLGTTLGEQGNSQRAVGVLEFAARLYPKDPAAQYNLGIAYGAQGRASDEIVAYRRAIELEPELIPAYQNLGAALLAAGQLESAADAYLRGLEMNPLSAVLYYNLSVVRRQQNQVKDAESALAVARAIDPDFVQKQQGRP